MIQLKLLLHGTTKVWSGKQRAAYETKHGDIDVVMSNGAKVMVEVKTDDLCQFTGNLQFEIMNHWNGDKLSHANRAGWWHHQVKSKYSVLIFVMVNGKSIQIDNVNEARKWCKENESIFEQVGNNKATVSREGKNTINIRCNAEEFVEACPYAKWIDIDTTEIDTFVKNHEFLGERRQRFEAFV